MCSIERSPETLESLRKVFTCIDNTTLEGCDTHQKVRELCRKSLEMHDNTRGIGHVAAVCVYPVFVSEAKRCLANSDIHVASVAGAFPAGQSPLAVKLQEVQYAVDEGADEIDMVISRGLLIEGEQSRVFDEIAAIRSITQGRVLKVILETGELKTEPLIAQASQIAIDAGADFIKTSTGKITTGATLEAAEIMLNVIKEKVKISKNKVGFKAAGGIREPEEALAYAELTKKILGADYINNQTFRVGASRLTDRLYSLLTF